MGQFSVKTYNPSGSLLSATQQKTVTPKAFLAPRYHFRRVGSQVVSNGFYFFPDHWSGGAISVRNGKMYMLKHIMFTMNMLGHISD